MDKPKLRLWRRIPNPDRWVKPYWGFGVVWDNNNWVHYSFAFHPWYRSLLKAWKHRKESINE